MRTTHNSTYDQENSDTLINCLRYKGGFDVPSGKGTCLIICALGIKKGFVEETILCFIGNSKSEDYLSSGMDSAHFKEWRTEKGAAEHRRQNCYCN